MLTLFKKLAVGIWNAIVNKGALSEGMAFVKDAEELLGLFMRLPELTEPERKVFLEGKDVLVATLGVLLTMHAGGKPTRAQKAKLQSELAEFIHAFGSVIDGLAVVPE